MHLMDTTDLDAPSPDDSLRPLFPLASDATVDRRPDVRDIVQLLKPGITSMSAIVAAGSMALAHATTGAVLPWGQALLAVVGVAASVAGAGALNMVLERDLDARMARTKSRPLPAGRMDPLVAVVIGLVLGVGAIPLLLVVTNAATAVLTAIALVSYVLVYTPMKQKSAWALVIGSVPGAMPALMGYTAMTGVVDAVGLVLFGIVFFWQIPHFLAITMYRVKEYTRAGHVVWAHTLGLPKTRLLVFVSAIPLVVVSLLLVPLDVAGPLYAAVALFLGLWFMRRCVRRYDDETFEQWGRRVFFATLIHQTVLFAALALDVGARTLL
jgi:protoheme IX farnesyltransferase